MKEKVWEELTELNSVLGKYEKDKLLKLIGVKLKYCLFLLKIFNHRRSGLDQKNNLAASFYMNDCCFSLKNVQNYM